MDTKVDEGKKQAYLKNNVANHIDGFRDVVKSSFHTFAISTGFSNLDALLDGGLYEGLYCIGAISSLGKTTIAMQMMDYIATQDQDVIIFSLEMARYELMAKSISRITFSMDRKCAKTVRGITNGRRYTSYSDKEKEIIKKSVDAYTTYAKNIYIHEGIGDIGASFIRKTVEDHVKYTGRKPVILIDYLQILAPHESRATDKQNTDKAVLELKRLSRDFKIPVIVISSFNRESYTSVVSMSSFKESGAIEYSSDVLIGLQLLGVGGNDKNFNIDDAKKKTPRDIEFKILKNRNGQTGDVVNFEYYPAYNSFEEA